MGPSPLPRRRRHTKPTHGPVTLDHHVFTKGEWKKARLRPHLHIKVTVSVDTPPQAKHAGSRHILPHAEIIAIPDTGTQSDLWSLSQFLACGFSRDDLRPVTIGLTAANRSPISTEGAFFAKLQVASSEGETTSCRSMVYVSSSFQAMYLSYESMLNLGLLPSTFPAAANTNTGKPHASQDHLLPINAVSKLNRGCFAPGSGDTSSCSCPQRDVTPQRPSELPFPCTPKKNGRMKTWLLDRYGSSTFNTCPHRALPCMEGPPIQGRRGYLLTGRA